MTWSDHVGAVLCGDPYDSGFAALLHDDEAKSASAEADDVGSE